MPIVSAVVPSSSLPSTAAGSVSGAGPTGNEPRTRGSFADTMQEVEASRPGSEEALGAARAPSTSPTMVVTELEEARVGQRIDELVDTASAVRSPSARERLLSSLSDLGSQYQQLLADVEGMKASPNAGMSHPGDASVDPAGAESAAPAESTSAPEPMSARDADAQFAGWRQEQTELLTLQIRAHRLMHSVEVVSKTVEQSVTGMKTVFQTQV